MNEIKTDHTQLYKKKKNLMEKYSKLSLWTQEGFFYLFCILEKVHPFSKARKIRAYEVFEKNKTIKHIVSACKIFSRKYRKVTRSLCKIK